MDAVVRATHAAMDDGSRERLEPILEDVRADECREALGRAKQDARAE